MSILFTIGAFIIVLSILVFVHEFGHFIVAKKLGIKVEEFAFGFPPRIWAKKKGETEYVINLIPFGGYVKLLGEGGAGSKKSGKRSYMNRNMRDRAKVAVAGVLMNVILAWLILSVGFSVGMQPFFVTSEDVFSGVSEGRIHLQEGATVKAVREGSVAEAIGFEAGDSIISIDGEEVAYPSQVSVLAEMPVGEFEIVRGDKVLDLEFTGVELDEYLGLHAMTEEKVNERNLFGVDFYELGYFPVVKVFGVDEGSFAYKSGMRVGDCIFAVNGERIFFVEEYAAAIEGEQSVTFSVYRDGVDHDVLVELAQDEKVIVSGVIEDMPAYEVGLREGDLILSVNGVLMREPDEFVNYVAEHTEETLALVTERDGEEGFYEITPEDGFIGVYLTDLFEGTWGDMSVYASDQFISQVAVDEEQYPVYEAPFVALHEVWRMAKKSVPVVINIGKQIFGEGEVPEHIAGPVGIAKMSGDFAREGLMSFFRFIALLSVSLAILNILPFPALDGGKLLFIFIEFVTGRKVPSKIENYIHAAGFLLLLALVIAVTYKDILRLF
jgi:regulator of sigma E protease